MKKHTSSTRKKPEELIPGYKHIYGTDRDRFRALSTDTFRFYIAESVWIPEVNVGYTNFMNCLIDLWQRKIIYFVQRLWLQ